MDGFLQAPIMYQTFEDRRQGPWHFSGENQIKFIVPIVIAQDPQGFNQGAMVLMGSKGGRQKDERAGEVRRLEPFPQRLADFREIRGDGIRNHAYLGPRKTEDSEQVCVADKRRQTSANGRFPSPQPDEPARPLMVTGIPDLEFVRKMTADEIMDEEHRWVRQWLVEEGLGNDPSVACEP